MKKKIIFCAWIVALVIIVATYLWPMSFSEQAADDAQMRIVMVGKNEPLSTYIFLPGSDEFKQIQQILGNYSYRRTPRTFLGGNYYEAGDWLLYLFSDGGGFDFGVMGEANVRGRIHRIGYSGNRKAEEMMNEFREVLYGAQRVFGEVYMKKFNEKLYLADMYADSYFPDFLVDKIKSLIVDVVNFLELGEHSLDAIQAKFDAMTEAINVLQGEFWENDSEIETGARESIGATVRYVLEHFNIDIDIEEAIRNRDW